MQQELQYRRSSSFNTTRNNNHDDQKIQYGTEEDANAVITDMRRQGKDEEGTLQSYYNPEYGKWFVGNSRRTNFLRAHSC